jgi:chromosome segregation ATPase
MCIVILTCVNVCVCVFVAIQVQRLEASVVKLNAALAESRDGFAAQVHLHQQGVSDLQAVGATRERAVVESEKEVEKLQLALAELHTHMHAATLKAQQSEDALVQAACDAAAVRTAHEKQKEALEGEVDVLERRLECVATDLSHANIALNKAVIALDDKQTDFAFLQTDRNKLQATNVERLNEVHALKSARETYTIEKEELQLQIAGLRKEVAEVWCVCVWCSKV